MLNVRVRKLCCFSLGLLLLAAGAFAQQTLGILRGLLTDESGALIPAATLTLTGPTGVRKSVQTQADGTFAAAGLAPGAWTVTIALPGFSPYEAKVDVAAAKTVQLNIALKVQAEKQEVTVKAEPGPQVSVEPDNNAGALVLRGADLEALSDDPDDLAADLQALAGPSAGPNGGQIFIDGFSGGSLPPKENIREIRVNQNPFSSEFDQLGYGRIEILTKPGTDKFHGSAFYYGGSDILDARNPYLDEKPYYLSKMFGGLLTGPLTKKSSFTFDVERRDVTDATGVVAQTIDPTTFSVLPINTTAPTPNVRTNVTPRLDYALTPNNTLVVRYTYLNSSQQNAGITQYTLPSRAYNTSMDEQRLQLTETAVLSPKVVNETRMEYRRTNTSQSGNDTIPSIIVQEAFNGGGAGVGNNSDVDNRWEIQNYTTTTLKTHTLRFGARVRTETETNTYLNNFNGTFTYAGGIAPMLDPNNQPVVDPSVCANVKANAIPAGCQQITSLQRYQRTLLFNSLGYSVAQMQPLGAGATLFSINGGNPLASVTQTDVGLFIQDDWRARQNLTVSMGMRYETQTNISDFRDFAPRIGIAWAPGARGGKTAKTVIRGGSGIFYTRFDNGYTLNTERFNGITEQSFSLVNPLFLTVPALTSLQAQPSVTRITDPNLRAPMIWQSAIGIERQLPKSTTLATSFTYSHGTHMFMTRDINAPTIPGVPSSRPYPGNEIFQYESAGIYNQRQLMVNFNTRASSRVSLFGFYTLSYSNSNTDGMGTLPANQYNLAGEYGRASLDSRHHVFIGGSVTTPLALRFSPYISASSGRPYNVITGRDFYGDSLVTDRPGIAMADTPGAIFTPCGWVNPNPSLNDPRVVRNCAEAPGYFSVNLRLSRTFGFGPVRAGYRGSGDSGGGGDHGHGDHGRGGPGGGGMRMGSMSGGHGMFEGGGSTERRFNLTVSASAHNLFNHLNPGMPSGNLTSPFFGIPISTASSFGPSAGIFNRRIDLSIRLTF